MIFFNKKDKIKSKKQLRINNRFVIYIGFNDKQTLSQKESTQKYISILCDICNTQKIEFTLVKSIGGYVNREGNYILEEGFQLSLLGANKEKTLQVADELKQRLNQETVIITEERMVVTHIIS